MLLKVKRGTLQSESVWLLVCYFASNDLYHADFV